MTPDMIKIPAGEFVMGLPVVPDGYSLPHRWLSGKKVRVKEFELSATAITNAQYRIYLDETGAEPNSWMSTQGFDDPNQPVVNINWFDARAYCEWLVKKTGESFRLPTDIEWEYAARGGRAGVVFPWGDDLDESRTCYGGQEAPKTVASYPPNGYGLYEMVGNVWQWCEDLFYDASGGEQAVNKINEHTDLTQNRVLRGGSFLTSNPHSLYIAYRHEDPPELRHQCLGFRIAKG